MNRARLTKNISERRRAAFNSHAPPLEPALVQFIEALAIADARRDHLALNNPIAPREIVDGKRMAVPRDG
jgi:hypothetical protein